MRHRYFGRPRIANAVLSGVLFAGAAARLATQRLINRIRYGRAITAGNADAAARERYQALAAGVEIKLNLGGGSKSLDGFINIDFVSHANVEREVVANILDLSFIPDGSVAQVHSNHVIEHLTKEDLDAQLRSYHRILRPGGILSVRCPNALGVCYGFWFAPILEGGREAFVAAGFPRDEDFGDARDSWYHRDLFGLLHWLHGNAGNPYNQHLNRLTPTSLRTVVEGAGFTIVKLSEPEATNLVMVARKAGGLGGARESDAPSRLGHSWTQV